MMKQLKNSFLFNLFLMISCSTFAQTQTFDVVSYTVPKGWQQQKNEGGLQLSISDKKTGLYAIAVITKSKASTASANDNFNNDWLKLVKGTVQITDEPTMQSPANENGWNLISGSANYTDGPNTASATLLTATAADQTVSVVFMTNTKQYQNDLLALINSLKLSKAPQNKIVNTTPATTNGAGKSSVAGLWCDNHLETSGYYNGFPQYTAGYFRREYLLKENGTYVFRLKNWSTLMKEILFVYETGTYTVQGNQLTIIPNQGKGEWWSKKDNNTSLWGSKIKASDYKLERMNYTFEIKYYSGTNNYSLILYANNNTERDGTYNQNGFSYSQNTGKSIIDNPPGLTIASVNTSSTATMPAQTNSATASVYSPLVGKIWEGSSLEKFVGAGTMTGHYTGGFSTGQYQFNADGTYRFVNVIASHYTNTKSLGYETGNWSVSGNQLTINPVSGQNEEWSKIGKTSNGNSDVTNRSINESWGNKIKTSTRNLQKYTYTFSIGKNGDKNALILQRSGHTEREGDGKITYYNETSPQQAAKLPAGKN